jgi:phage terminase large subunit-like protein
MTRSTACLDWADRIRRGQSIIPNAPLFPEQARQALAVFRALRLVDVIGQPTLGEVSRPWVTDFVGQIFGAYDADSGRRLISEFFLLISKKNGKSTDAAGIMMAAAILNWRMSAEYLILAPTIEVAKNSFFPARDMVRSDPELSDIFQVQDHTRTITHRETRATLQVVAADSETVSGKKATGVLIDELWAFGSKANAENMLREACGGLASRPEGFVIYLTTQSDTPPAGVFASKLAYARGVRDGLIDDPGFLPVLYEFPDGMIKDGSARELKNFYITNPNLGASVDEVFLAREYRKAEEAGEASMRGFLSKHANIEIGMSLMANRWAGADFWESCADPDGLTLDELIERSEVVDIGIDGGGLDDLFGLSVVGRDAKTREWLVWAHAWAHPSVLQRNKKEAARFADFAADGDLTLVERIGDDLLEVAAIVRKVEDSGILDQVGTDPAGIGGVLDALEAVGIPGEKVIGITQGWKMTGAIKTTERKLAEGGMRHGGSAMMTWCVGNARSEPRGNAIVITKQASGSAKIDPLMAVFNAVTLMALNPEGRRAYTGELRTIDR